MQHLMEHMTKLLSATGAIIMDDMFITSPGIMVMKEPVLTEEMGELMRELKISEGADHIKSSEFNSKLTYLSFKKSDDPGKYVEKITGGYGHYSVCGDWHVSLLIAGISDEILKELVAHHEGHFSRLTSSNTKVQEKTYYVLYPDHHDEQIRYIREFLELRERHRASFASGELWNSLNLPCKAAYCVMTMSLKDYHKFLIGRMSHDGNETEVRQIATVICDILHKKFPEIIREPSFYRGQSNTAKLALDS